jgi:predicted secreted protein
LRSAEISLDFAWGRHDPRASLSILGVAPFNRSGEDILSLIKLGPVAVVMLLIGAPAGAASPDPAPGIAEATTTLHLTERADRQLQADRLHATLRAEVTGPDARAVQGAINKAMAAALGKAKDAGGVEVETGGYTVFEDRAPNAPARWRGSQALTLSGKNTDAVLALAGVLQGIGLAMSGMAYDLTPETTRGVQDELTATALDHLKQRAERIAASMNLAVLRFRDVRVGNVDDEGVRPKGPMRAMAAAAAMPAPVGEAGMISVAVSVDAEIVLAPSGTR